MMGTFALCITTGFAAWLIFSAYAVEYVSDDDGEGFSIEIDGDRFFAGFAIFALALAAILYKGAV